MSSSSSSLEGTSDLVEALEDYEAAIGSPTYRTQDNFISFHEAFLLVESLELFCSAH